VIATAAPEYLTDPSLVASSTATPVVVGCLLGLVLVAPLQLYLLNLALAAGNASFAVPLYICQMTLLVSVSGGLLLGEFAALLRPPMPQYLVLYVGGVSCVCVGIIGLSVNRPAERAERAHGSPQQHVGSSSTSSDAKAIATEAAARAPAPAARAAAASRVAASVPLVPPDRTPKATAEAGRQAKVEVVVERASAPSPEEKPTVQVI